MSALFPRNSGVEYLQTTFEPIDDKLDYEDHYDESEEEELLQDQDNFYTLDELGFSFNGAGALVLHTKMEKVEAVFKKTKLPAGSKMIELAENECSICFMETEAEELVITSCKHKYCRDCLSYYLQLESGDVNKLSHTESYLEPTPQGDVRLRVNSHCGIPCPHPTCSHIIEGPEFEALVDERTAKRYQELSLLVSLKALHKKGDLDRCPEPNCGSWMQNCECIEAKCRRMTARRRKRILDQTVMTTLNSYLRTADVHRCPSCKVVIEKNGGCDHMFCTACKKPFNWSGSSRVAPLRRQ